MSAFSVIEKQAMYLTVDERALFAHKLLESVQSGKLSDVEKAWLPIIEERYRNFQSGETQPIPAKEALMDIRKAFGWQ